VPSADTSRPPCSLMLTRSFCSFRPTSESCGHCLRSLTLTAFKTGHTLGNLASGPQAAGRRSPGVLASSTPYLVRSERRLAMSCSAFQDRASDPANRWQMRAERRRRQNRRTHTDRAKRTPFAQHFPMSRPRHPSRPILPPGVAGAPKPKPSAAEPARADHYRYSGISGRARPRSTAHWIDFTGGRSNRRSVPQDHLWCHRWLGP
jgi:hypothetical protein